MDLTTIENDTLVTFRLFGGRYLAYYNAYKGCDKFTFVKEADDSMLFFVMKRNTKVFILGSTNTNKIFEIIDNLSENTSDDEFFRELHDKYDFVKIFIMLRCENGRYCNLNQSDYIYQHCWWLNIQLFGKKKELVFEWVYSAPYPMNQTIRQPLHVEVFDLNPILK